MKHISFKKIVLAYSYYTSKPKTVVEQWSCDNDCLRNTKLYAFISSK